jgi:hypothetical protein
MRNVNIVLAEFMFKQTDTPSQVCSLSVKSGEWKPTERGLVTSGRAVECKYMLQFYGVCDEYYPRTLFRVFKCNPFAGVTFVRRTKNVGESDVQLNLSSKDSGHNGNLSLAEKFYRPENLASRGRNVKYLYETERVCNA